MRESCTANNKNASKRKRKKNDNKNLGFLLLRRAVERYYCNMLVHIIIINNIRDDPATYILYTQQRYCTGSAKYGGDGDAQLSTWTWPSSNYVVNR